MKREWHPDELVEHWTILPEERHLIGNKSGATRLGFAVLLKFFQYEGRFPHHPHDIPSSVVQYVAHQVGPNPTFVSPGAISMRGGAQPHP